MAAEKVKRGSTVVYPTDTVYGLGCDPYDDAAVKSLIRIKNRGLTKPLPLLCSSFDEAYKIGKFDRLAMKLAERFWPGALTIVVKVNDKKISKIVTAGTESIGLRVPNHPCALKLISACGGVLVGTSANRSCCSSARTVDEVLRSIKDFDIIIDGGETSGVESTVVMIGQRNAIVREGQIKQEQIAEVLNLV